MKYKTYKKAVEKITSVKELERILKLVEEDFEEISDRQYESLRNQIINKIYA